MKIDKQSWHCKTYQWWYNKKYGGPNIRGYSNLCPYMRAVMLWAPVRFLFTGAISFGKVPLGIFTIPAVVLSAPLIAGYFNYSLKSGIWFAYFILGGAALGLALCLGLVYTISTDGLDITSPLREKIKKSSFVDLIAAYLRSAHDRVCPEVEWHSPSFFD